MIRTIFVTVLCVAYSLEAQTPVSPAEQANVEAEMQMLRAWEELREARHILDETISNVRDPDRQKLLRDALTANVEAFDKLLDAEAILRYGGSIVGRDGKPDVRVRRVVDATHAKERAQLFKEWNKTILRVTAK